MLPGVVRFQDSELVLLPMPRELIVFRSRNSRERNSGLECTRYGPRGFLLPGLEVYMDTLPNQFPMAAPPPGPPRVAVDLDVFTVSQHTGVLLHAISLLGAALPRAATGRAKLHALVRWTPRCSPRSRMVFPESLSALFGIPRPSHHRMR